MTYEHRLTSKSQVTIPKDVRKALGIEPGGLVRFEIDGGRVSLSPGDHGALRAGKFDAAVKKWAGRFATGRSTDDQMRELRGDRDL
jgi:antitoxin PrlF